MEDKRSTRSSLSPNRYSSGDDGAEVDDRILFGMEKLVNKIKVKEKTPSIKSKRSKHSQRSQQSSKKIATMIQPQVDEKKPVDTVSVRSSKSKKWSKSSGEPIDRTIRMPSESPKGLFDFFQDIDCVSTQASFIKDEEKSAQMKEELKHLEPIIEPSVKPKTKEQELDEKIELLAEWEELIKKTRDRNAKRFTINSDLEDIRIEIKKVKAQKKRENALKFMGLATYTLAKGCELLCTEVDKRFNVNIPLDGWPGSVKHNMGDFDEVFNELYDKFKTSGKGLPPELRFLIIFFTSAINFIIMNKAPQAIADLINAGRTRSTRPSTTKPYGGAAYREMSPPDIDGDPELEELLFDLEQRKEARKKS